MLWMLGSLVALQRLGCSTSLLYLSGSPTTTTPHTRYYRFKRSQAQSAAAAVTGGGIYEPSNWTAEQAEDFVGNGNGEISDEDHCQSFLYALLDFAQLYYVPSIILLGLMGNLLSCVVFLNTHLKLRSSSYYLAALSTTDFTFLVTLLLVWLNGTIGWQVFNKDGWCQALVYVSSVASSLSVWLIVAFTVERYIAVQYPLRRPNMCTVSRAKRTVLGLLALAMLSHTYAFFTAGIKLGFDGNEYCQMKDDWMEVMRIVNSIDSLVSLIVPLVLIVFMNSMIVKNLVKFNQRFQPVNYTGSTMVMAASCTPDDTRPAPDLNYIVPVSRSKSSSSNNKVNGIAMGSTVEGRKNPSQQSFNSSSQNEESHHSRTTTSQPVQQTLFTVETPLTPKNVLMPEITTRMHVRTTNRSQAATRTQQNTTKLLLIISSVFVSLNLPSYAIRLVVFYYTAFRNEFPPMSLWCIQQSFMLLYYTNFSINFLLYAMCGSTFRRCLVQLLRKCLKSLTRYHCNPQRFT
ncbi:hypothetical protein TKK_0011713 [Trichogramma kaykai]